ncbi:MAG: cell division protein ZapE [Parvularculales bacterium]
MTPIVVYDQLVTSDCIEVDVAQAATVARLEALHNALGRYGKGKRFGVPGFRRRSQPPKGLYIWGGVGRGKSMLMDMFFDTAPLTNKRRVHFHAFMAETHERIFTWREGEKSSRGSGGGDPIAPVARDIAHEAALLCFDEFQVTDIADASILGRLFSHLFDLGVVVVATSNRAPEGLYEGGLNRQRFLPFIDLLHDHMMVLELDGDTDYRLNRLGGRPVYFSPLNEAAVVAMDEAFERLTGGTPPMVMTAEVKGRTLTVPCAAMGAARFSFEELCARPLGVADYGALASRFHTLMIDGVPVLAPEKRNEAARFVSLIDILYEHGSKLVMSAAALPEAIYPAGDGSFEFRRTASRLAEMQSVAYLERGHGVLPQDRA